MAFITVAGEQLIAQKQGESELLVIPNFVLANIDGLGPEPPDRIEALPDAGDIVATRPVTKQAYVNANQVVFSLVMDSSVGDFDFNWVGLVSQENTLIACAHIPTIQKRATSGGIPGNNITRNFLIAYSGIQTTTAIDVPADTWQIDFTARLLGIDERERLSNYDIYGHEAFFGDGFEVTHISGTDYEVGPGIGYVGGIRAALAAPHALVATPWPTAVWLDVSLQGDITGMEAVIDYIVSADAQTDYTDPNGFDHYVTKIADIDASGNVTDRRLLGSIADQIQDAINKLDHKQSVRFTTTANINLTGLGTQAGGDWSAALTAGDRILVKDQTAGNQNGIYVAASGAWARATDADGNPEVTAGMTVTVTEGATLADTQYELATNDPIVVGTTALTFKLVGHGAEDWVRAVIEAAGLTPDQTDSENLLDALEAGWGMAKNLAGNGYARMPGGIIIQWGSNNVVHTGTVITYPVAFTQAPRIACNVSDTIANVLTTLGAVGATTFGVRLDTAGTFSVSWIAIGF
jgi:hypothetical protein